MQWFPKSAPRTTGGPRDKLKWSAYPNINQYFVLRGALKYFKWSAHKKSLGTTEIVLYLYFYLSREIQSEKKILKLILFCVDSTFRQVVFNLFWFMAPFRTKNPYLYLYSKTMGFPSSYLSSYLISTIFLPRSLVNAENKIKMKAKFLFFVTWAKFLNQFENKTLLTSQICMIIL